MTARSSTEVGDTRRGNPAREQGSRTCWKGGTEGGRISSAGKRFVPFPTDDAFSRGLNGDTVVPLPPLTTLTCGVDAVAGFGL